MNAEIISVGTELMLGDIPNTDAQYISSRLAEIGIDVVCHSTINDEPKDIRTALSHALPRSSVIIFTGGLGPTPDDLTKETVCSAVGIELKLHEESKRRIDAFFERTGRTATENNYKQAMLPVGATVFANDFGTAPGCAISAGKQWIIMLPGPPKELVPMFDSQVMPYLDNIGNISHTVIKTMSVFGIGESQIATTIDGYLHSQNPIVATYASDGIVNIKITAKGEDIAACNALAADTAKGIKALLGDCVFSTEGDSLAKTAVEALKSAKLSVTPAESCTAGMLAATITSVEGASKIMSSGIVAYSNDVKIELLGVSRNIIDKFGVYSVETAQEMAKSAKKLGKSSIGIGITGIASPDVSVDVQAGLVYVSLYDGKNCYSRKLVLGRGRAEDRELVRRGAVNHALDMCRLYATGRVLSIANLPVVASEAVEVASNPQMDYYDQAKEFNINDMEIAEETDIYSGSAFEDNNTTDDNQKNKFISFLKSWIPWKGDTRNQIIRKSALIFFATVFIASAAYIVDYVAESIRTQNTLEELQGMYDPNAEGILGADGININFQELIERNPDTIGWLYVPGTQVNNPVVKKDNDHYLYIDFDGNKNKHGTLFVDENCTIEPGRLSRNTVIYGHHMKDGTMFGELKYYRTDTSDGLEFYKENPIIEFTSIYQTKATKWKIFSVFVTNANPAQDNGYVFNYWQNGNNFSDRDYAQFIYECQRRSMIDTAVDVTTDDFIITLSTCVYDFSDARLVVMARLVRDGEAEVVDVNKASVNYDAKFPAAYYGSGEVPKDSTSSNVEMSSKTSLPNIIITINSSPSDVSDVQNGSSVQTSVPENSYDTNSGMENDDYSDVTTQTPPETSQVSSEPVVSEVPPVDSQSSDVSSQPPEVSSDVPSQEQPVESQISSEESTPSQIESIVEPESQPQPESITGSPESAGEPLG